MPVPIINNETTLSLYGYNETIWSLKHLWVHIPVQRLIDKHTRLKNGIATTVQMLVSTP